MAEDRIAPSLLEKATSKENFSPRLKGTAIHRLLQVLPDMAEDERWNAAEKYLVSTLPEYTTSKRQVMVDNIRATLLSSDLSKYLDPATSRAEVSIMGQIDLASGPRPVSGSIDRLAVLEDEVMLIDYKTSANPPTATDDVSPDYITQMALYRALVAKLYPTKPINTALVWTHAPDGPLFMPLPKQALEDAFSKIAKL